MNDRPTSLVRKRRRRKIWACDECRRRKIQCDRDRPFCGACRKTDHPANCQYADTPGARHTVTRSSSASNISLTLDSVQRNKAMQLFITGRDSMSDLSHHAAEPERGTSLLKPKTVPALASTKNIAPLLEVESPWLVRHSGATHDDSDQNVLHSPAFRGKFHGSTFPGTLAQCIPGLSDFTTDAFAAFPVLEDIRGLVSHAQQLVSVTSNAESRPSRKDLVKFLDSRAEVDSDVQHYLTNHDHVYHVLHRPTFDRDYAQLWTDLEGADVRQIILVLLIVAIVRFSRIPSSGAIEVLQQATEMMQFCEVILQTSIQRYDHALDFQLTFLLLLGKQLSGKWFKRTWVSAGSALRVWMCAGLHRNYAALHSRATAATRELRARLWASVAEFELQAAFEHGMSGHSWSDQCEVASPLDVPDIALEQDPKPDQHFGHTATTFLAVSSKSLRLRHKVNELLNGSSQALTTDQVNAYTREISQHLHNLNPSEDAQAQSINALLSINLLQYLLALHVRQLQTCTSKIEQRMSRVVLVETAWHMLRHHRAAIDHGSQLIEAMYGDHVRIALSVCYCYITSDPQSDCIITTAIETRSFEIIQVLLSLIGNKAELSLGCKHHSWLIAACLGHMQASKDLTKRMIHMENAVQQFIKPYATSLQEQQTHPQSQDHVNCESHNAFNDTSEFHMPTHMDLSIDEWFYQWCGDPTMSPSGTWLPELGAEYT